MLATLPEVTTRIDRLATIEKLLDAHDPDSIHLVEEQAEITERLVMHNGFVMYDLQTSILSAF